MSAVGKCEIIIHIEKGMANKEASEKFGAPKNAVSTWMKKENFSLYYKKLHRLPKQYVDVITEK